MKLITDKLKHCLMALIGVAAMALSACDNFIYEDEGDCDPYYRVRFVYDMNMKFTDAFPQEVNSVTLYLVDTATGNIVWQKHEEGEALHSAAYEMEVDVQPGDYTLVAWAGDGHKSHFSIPETNIHRELKCTLGRTQHPDGYALVDHDLDRLYHGKLEDQNFPTTQGVHYYTVPLIKNTNDIVVVLQHTDGSPVDENMFDFTIHDANGYMDWDNSLLPDETITYRAYDKYPGVAEFELDYAPARTVTSMSAAVAEHTVARLMADHKNTCRLTVTNTQTGEKVFSIPLIQYVLMVKGNHSRKMTDQEYLDREDHYSLTFFLDKNNRWLSAQIYINSWKLVLQQSDL